MDRAELRLRILGIVHHDRHNVQTVLKIVSEYEAAFADIALEGEEPKPSQPPPAPRTPRQK